MRICAPLALRYGLAIPGEGSRFLGRVKIKSKTELEPIRVVLADNHDMVRAGIKALLTRIVGVEVVAEAKNRTELLTILAGVTPDLVVTDMTAAELDGVDASEEIRDRYPGTKVLVLSTSNTLDFFRQAMAHGASGYLTKDSSPDELELAVRSIAVAGRYFDPTTIAQPLPQHDEAPKPTSMQVKILELTTQGYSVKEIASELGLGTATVKARRKRIRDPLRPDDWPSVKRNAVRKGLIKP